MRSPLQTWLLFALAAGSAIRCSAQVEKVAMRTTGISCGVCAGLSEIYFRRLSGVDQVKISISNEAIMLTFKPGAAFDPAAIRKILQPLEVGVSQFQIGARGRVQEQAGKRFFIAGKDKFLVLDAVNSPTVPLDAPVRIEGILYDRATPMEVIVLSVKPVP